MDTVDREDESQEKSDDGHKSQVPSHVVENEVKDVSSSAEDDADMLLEKVKDGEFFHDTTTANMEDDLADTEEVPDSSSGGISTNDDGCSDRISTVPVSDSIEVYSTTTDQDKVDVNTSTPETESSTTEKTLANDASDLVAECVGASAEVDATLTSDPEKESTIAQSEKKEVDSCTETTESNSVPSGVGAAMSTDTTSIEGGTRTAKDENIGTNKNPGKEASPAIDIPTELQLDLDVGSESGSTLPAEASIMEDTHPNILKDTATSTVAPVQTISSEHGDNTLIQPIDAADGDWVAAGKKSKKPTNRSNQRTSRNMHSSKPAASKDSNGTAAPPSARESERTTSTSIPGTIVRRPNGSRILLLADVQGFLSSINYWAKKTNATHVVCTGTFGFFPTTRGHRGSARPHQHHDRSTTSTAAGTRAVSPSCVPHPWSRIVRACSQNCVYLGPNV